MNNSEDLIKKYQLSEAIKRIQKINEYTFYDSTMVEADEDPNAAQAPQQGGDMPQMGGEDMNVDPNGGGMQALDGGQGGDMSQMSGEDMNVNPNSGMGQMDMPQGDDMSQMGGNSNSEMMPMGDEQGIEGQGDDFMTDDNIEDVEMDTEQPGDEVIDVDELTQSQETTEFKVDNVDDKLDKVLQVISKFNDAIDANDKKIEDLKKEFEKRNPTAEETLNLRSLASYPFSERPDEYWKKQQEKHPNYRVISDNDVPTAEEQKEFEIRKSDIDNFNERDIMKSLGENHIKLSDFLQL